MRRRPERILKRILSKNFCCSFLLGAQLRKKLEQLGIAALSESPHDAILRPFPVGKRRLQSALPFRRDAYEPAPPIGFFRTHDDVPRGNEGTQIPCDGRDVHCEKVCYLTGAAAAGSGRLRDVGNSTGTTLPV